jgi:hypothetical protein
VYPFRIEKHRLTVHLSLLGGECVHGVIFVQPSVYGYVGGEEAVDIFNAPEPFFPIETDGGELMLLSKARVIEAWGVQSPDEDELRHAGARVAGLEVTLVDGTVRTGTVMLEMPTDRPRLLDFLNHQSEPFVTLYTGDDVRLINLRAVHRIRPLD